MSKENCNLQHFTTEDLHLAAYLNCCQNIEFKGTESSDHEETKQFIFEGEEFADLLKAVRETLED